RFETLSVRMESQDMLQLMRMIIVGSLLSAIGCASGLPVRDYATSQAEPCLKQQIERGKPQPVVDGIGWVVGIPTKIILWDRRVKTHSTPPPTEAAITRYVDETGLTKTKVRLNQYAPIDEWRRLTANQEVAWGWRYTVGAITWLDEA